MIRVELLINLIPNFMNFFGETNGSVICFGIAKEAEEKEEEGEEEVRAKERARAKERDRKPKQF